VGEDLAEVVSSRQDARAYRVEGTSNGATETELATRFLG
jgi:hypothetical protein